MPELHCAALGRVLGVAVLLLAQPATAADSPGTVGALLDGGGKQLTKGEIVKLFAGATIHGTAMGSSSSTFELRYLPDGTANGVGRSPGGSTKISGKWSANEHDQYCQDLHTEQGMPIKGCFSYFTFGNRLFAAPTAERSATLYERRLTR